MSEGEDSPPPRPRRKIKRIVLASSSSASESDDSGPAAATRKKRLRVLSDEDSESSGSSVVLSGRRRRLPRLHSDEDSDTSGSGSERAAAAAPARAVSGFASDSSEGNSDKCSICLMRFTDQQVGTPESCEHIFCLDCITEWSKNVNTCPVDRMTFNTIVVRVCAGGRVLGTQPVQMLERVPSVEMMLVEDHTTCEICGSANNEETMLLCDGCDLGFHMECLAPPLTQVPISRWFCPSCTGRHEFAELLVSDIEGLLSDVSDEGPSTSRAAGRAVRAPRQAGTARAPAASGSRGGPRATRAAHPGARRTARRKPRRRRTVIIEYEIEENGKFPITRRVRRRIKKRKIKKRAPRTAARRTQVRSSVRAKLEVLRSERAAAASALTAAPAVAALAARRSAAGIAPLSLFGSARDLHYFSDEEPEERGEPRSAGAAVAVRPALAALHFRRQARRKMISIPSPPAGAAAPDLLASILESQTLLHSRDAVVCLTVDGDVDIKLARRATPPAPAAPPAPSAPTAAPAPVATTAPPAPSAPAAAPAPASSRVDVKRGDAAPRQAPSYPGRARGAGGWGGGYRYPRERAPPAYARAPHDNGYGAGGARAPAPHAGDGARQHRDLVDYESRRAPQYPAEEHLRRREERARGAPPAWSRPLVGFEAALDMRVPPGPPAPLPPDKPAYGPLPEPPQFRFAPDEDDPGLVIDTDKYDPTEPTEDEAPPPAAPVPEGARGVPAAVLDSAVRQVLHEHRTLIEPCAPDRSDEDEDGDCPNFSIYSATSVHIASHASARADAAPPPAPDELADLVQQDGAPSPPPPPPSPPPAPPADRRRSDEINERVSKRCPITTNTRNPIKIKLNTPSLIRRQVSLYDEEEDAEPEAEPDAPDNDAATLASDERDAKLSTDRSPKKSTDRSPRNSMERSPKKAIERSPQKSLERSPKKSIERSPQKSIERSPQKSIERSPKSSVEGSPKSSIEGSPEKSERSPGRSIERSPRSSSTRSPDRSPKPRSERSPGSEVEEEAGSERHTPSVPRDLPAAAAAGEKMTESISETEDERSYTPCLDERDRDPSADREPAADRDPSADRDRSLDRDRGLDGLDTEMISEDEGNDMFSDERRSAERTAPPPPRADDAKKKKKKESKRDTKKGKGKLAFKKLAKGGKERNYRERSRSDGERSRRASAESERARRKKEKRKDLERYDVRTLVSERRRRPKDAFGRDVSPRAEPEPTPPRRRASSSPRRRPPSGSPRHRGPSASPRRRPSASPRRRLTSASPRRRLTSASPRRRLASTSPRRRVEPEPTPPPVRRSASPRRRRRRSSSRTKRAEGRRRRSGSRPRKRRRSASGGLKPKAKKKKRARSERPRSRSRTPRRKSPKRKRVRRSPAAAAAAAAVPAAWSPRPASPRTPPPAPAPEERRVRKRRDRSKHRRLGSAGPSKEVFTSGDNILVSVSFKEQEKCEEEGRRERRRERRRRRRRAANEEALPKPVAIIDLERSPFRELTPSPKNVIVLSDDEPGAPGAGAAPPPPAVDAAGPKTPPEPSAPAAPPAPAPAGDSPRGPNTPPEPPDSPDAYDPYEPTRSASASPGPEPARPSMTLEAAQKTNMSADEVLDRRPLSPIEKVMALLQSTRDVSPEPPPAAGSPPAAPRIVLPEATRPPAPKLFLGKPSPIKSDPIKPMQQATKISRLPLPRGGESPYSPGSSDFGELFSPPPGGKRDGFDALFDKPPAKGGKKRGKLGKNKKKGKTQVDVKIDEDNIKVVDELPNSAVEMQVKSKFLKKLNRQERVVEEVKLVLKPHYNKKHVSKEEYKHILRRAVPKICHNKTGEINPTKIQALVEAYVKKFRKRRKLGLV